MRNINKRVENIEKELNLNEKPKTVTIVHFGNELPPDRTEGDINIHFLKHDKLGEI